MSPHDMLATAPFVVLFVVSLVCGFGTRRARWQADRE